MRCAPFATSRILHPYNMRRPKTVNIPQLGTNQLNYDFGHKMEKVRSVRFTTTPPFGEARKRGDDRTTIIKK